MRKRGVCKDCVYYSPYYVMRWNGLSSREFGECAWNYEKNPNEQETCGLWRKAKPDSTVELRNLLVHMIKESELCLNIIKSERYKEKNN